MFDWLRAQPGVRLIGSEAVRHHAALHGVPQFGLDLTSRDPPGAWSGWASTAAKVSAGADAESRRDLHVEFAKGIKPG